MTRTAAIYCRISDDREGSGLGVKRQETDCRALCKRRGWQVATLLVDNDLSAYNGKPRPGYRQLVEAVKDRSVDVLVAWHPDRITRSPRELEDLVELVEASGVEIATVTAGDYDLGTPTGRMVARIVGATARGESEHKSERVRRKARELAEAGKVGGGGTRPFGFEPDRVTVRESEAELIREAAARVLAGEALRSVLRDWHGRGIVTPTGKAWKPTSLRRVLMSARISGRREHRGAIVGDAEWDAIITPDESDRLRAILGAVNPTRAPRRYLLTGLARCGLCGVKLVARPRQDGARCYVCATSPSGDGCGKIRILSEPLEAMVVEAVVIRLDTPELAAAVAKVDARPERDPLDDLAAVTARERELADLWAAGELSREAWLAARRSLDERADALKREASAEVATKAAAPLLKPGMLRKTWDDLDFDHRRAVVEAVVDTVTVGPGRRGFNRFDPDRVTIGWAD